MMQISEMTWYWGFTGVIMVLPHFICSLLLPKRNHYVTRYIIISVAALIICFLDPFLPISFISIWAIHITGILMIILCNKMNIGQYIYFNIWCIVLYFTAEQLGAILASAFNEYNNLKIMYLTKSISSILLGLMEIVLIRQIIKKGMELIQGKQILLSALISVIIIGVNVFGFTGTKNRQLIEFLFQFFTFIVAILALFLQVVIAHGNRQQNKAEFMKYLMRENRKNYEMKKAYVDLVDRKYHDLKYEIKALRHMAGEEIQERLNQLENDADGYQNLFHTGSEVIDTIINDKKRECDSRKILFTCVSHTDNISFMDMVDINILLGNIIDNAVEAVETLPEEKRVIDIKIFTDKQYLRIRETNYYAGELKYSGNHLVSTKSKDGYHGFGTNSMKYVVEKYNGEIVINGEDNVFQVHIVIPIPEDSISGN